MTNIVIVDSQWIFLEALSHLLQTKPSIQLLHTFTTKQETMEYLESSAERIDIILISLQLYKGYFDGIPLAKYILRHFATIKLIVYSVHEVGKHIEEMYHEGIGGYLFQDSPTEEWFEAIQQVSQGKIYFSDRAKGIMERYRTASQTTSPKFKGKPS